MFGKLTAAAACCLSMMMPSASGASAGTREDGGRDELEREEETRQGRGRDDVALTLLNCTADGDSVTTFTLGDLRALPESEVVTGHRFVDGEVTYSGPLVRDLLRLAGVGGLESYRFIAANDYFVDFPRSDIEELDLILAMQADGEPLTRRSYGPLWLMYPISDHPEMFDDPTYTARLIWQVTQVEACR